MLWLLLEGEGKLVGDLYGPAIFVSLSSFVFLKPSPPLNLAPPRVAPPCVSLRPDAARDWSMSMFIGVAA